LHPIIIHKNLNFYGHGDNISGTIWNIILNDTSL